MDESKFGRFGRYGGVLIAAALAVSIAFATFGGDTQDATANHTPANKTIATGSTLQWLTTVGQGKQVLPILSGKMRTSTPADLLIQVTAECALWTSTATQSTGGPNASDQKDASETAASVAMWVTIDNESNVVPVVSTDPKTKDSGNVVFCNRAQRMETEFMQVEDTGDGDQYDTMRIRNYLKTRSANGFNWLALNLGNGIHTFTLWAELNAEVLQQGKISASHTDVNSPAAAAVGKRTMIIQPQKMANDATVTNVN